MRRPDQAFCILIGPRVNWLAQSLTGPTQHFTRRDYFIYFDFVCNNDTSNFRKATMSRILYGSSNVYRNFSRSTISGDLNLTLVECTRKVVFNTHLTGLGKLAEHSLLVTSVLENFVTDASRGLPVEEVGLFACQEITTHLESLASLLRGSPTALGFVWPLLHRSAPGLFIFVEKRKGIGLCSLIFRYFYT